MHNDKITIHPGRLRQFGPGDGVAFCLLTNTDIADRFVIEEDGSHSSYQVTTYDREGMIAELLADTIPEPAHILVASPNIFFRSPRQELIGPKRKLIAMACNSTPTPPEALAHFIGVIERTDPYEQEAFADGFFARGQATEHLEFVDEAYGTSAIFDHLDESYQWNQQAGPLEWGEQQIAPAGEISVLPVDIWEFDPDLRLSINGTFAFRGLPILHSGEPSFLRKDQSRIFGKLRCIRDHAVIATVKNGEITALAATHKDVEPAAKMMETMFAVDSRYRILWELGFAINTALDLLQGNYAMNEVYGGTNGAMHFGLGLTPYTQYHLDIICPNTKVLGADGSLVLGTSSAAPVEAYA